MPRLRVSMRWWLALAFALIVTLTAVVVAQLFTSRAERALDERAEQIASGSTFTAAREITDALEGSNLQQTVDVLARGGKLNLFVFDERRMIAEGRYRSFPFGESPQHRDALASARSGRRYVDSADHGASIVVGLPLRRGALVSVARRKDLVAEESLFREEIVRAALWAVLIGAVTGLIVAVAIAARLRRIRDAAASIEGGDFSVEMHPGFGDEVGQLAATFDRMRVRLHDSFERLESERDQLRTLFEQLQDGVIAVDGDLRVTLANSTARTLLGTSLTEGEALPEPWPDLSLRTITAHLFEHGTSVAQARVSPAEGATLAIAGIPAPSGTLALLVVSDVSARERRERAEREFVANAAHELRTPIAAIANAVEALEGGAKDSVDDRDRFLAIVERQTTRLGRLVRALLALARAQTREEPLRLEPVLLRPVLTEVANELEPADGVEVAVDAPPALAALAQRDLLVQVVGNLARNAVKHTAEGRVVLRAGASEGETVVVEVADSGAGMDVHDQQRVFDRFYSGDDGHRHGFGLGLAIVREAVSALGGRVDIESTPGEGTRARVTLAAPAKVVA